MFTAAKNDPALKHAAEELRDDVTRLKADVRDAASVVREDLHDVARQAGRHARNLASNAEASVTDAATTVSDKIREKPIQSTAIALGVGIVIGALLRR